MIMGFSFSANSEADRWTPKIVVDIGGFCQFLLGESAVLCEWEIWMDLRPFANPNQTFSWV